jgi:hypothetical protein
MPRIFDLFAVLAVAVVILLPKASVDAKPALDGEPLELDRIAELQDDLYRNPDDVEAAAKLSDGFLSFMRADWALATMSRFADRSDYRVHLTLATAHAERLEAKQVVDEIALVEKGCADADAGKPNTVKCPEGTLARAGLLHDAMQALLDGSIDPAKDPVAAKDAVYKALHPAKYNLILAPHPPAPPKK